MLLLALRCRGPCAGTRKRDFKELTENMRRNTGSLQGHRSITSDRQQKHWNFSRTKVKN